MIEDIRQVLSVFPDAVIIIETSNSSIGAYHQGLIDEIKKAGLSGVSRLNQEHVNDEYFNYEKEKAG